MPTNKDISLYQNTDINNFEILSTSHLANTYGGNLDDFKLNLYNLRTKKDISQTQLADIADIDDRTIRKYESGSTLPNIKNTLKIANALNTTVELLFEDN